MKELNQYINEALVKKHITNRFINLGEENKTNHFNFALIMRNDYDNNAQSELKSIVLSTADSLDEVFENIGYRCPNKVKEKFNSQSSFIGLSFQPTKPMWNDLFSAVTAYLDDNNISVNTKHYIIFIVNFSEGNNRGYWESFTGMDLRN